MARHAAVSPRTFARRFREETGTTPLQWLLSQRVLEARRLLEETDLPIEEIACARRLRHRRLAARPLPPRDLDQPDRLPAHLQADARSRVRAAMSRRDQIKLSEEELGELLDGERVVIVTSLGPRGWPHSMPMWFVPREGNEIWIWTYAKSQKVRNLERDPRATLLIETGHEYGELRGAMIEAEAEIQRDFETVLGFAEDLTLRYAEGISSVEGDAKAALEAQAPKRVAIRFGAVRTATWDHRKLGGTY